MTNLKARCFAAYLGATLHYIGEDKQFREKSPYKLLGVEINSTQEMIFVNGGYAFHPDSCQIELKPLSSISDEDAIEVAKIILKRDAQPYNYTFNQIHRINYDNLSGCDAEECVIVCMDATPVDDSHKIAGWEDTKFRVKIVERDRYNSKPYFNISALHKDKWINWGGSNELEADYLRSRSYLLPFLGHDLLKENIAIIKTEQ